MVFHRNESHTYLLGNNAFFSFQPMAYPINRPETEKGGFLITNKGIVAEMKIRRGVSNCVQWWWRRLDEVRIPNTYF